MRNGEMAALREVPFGLYYGSVDATPLFVMLAGLYAERTGDDATIVELWPAIEAALAWIDGPADADRDGFVEYYRATEQGLANQGWKDSHDAIFHADGRLAEGPIALTLVFHFPRPQSHFTKKGLRPDAPMMKTSTPDLDNCVKAVKDSMKGIVWRDDAQVTWLFARKIYTVDEPRTEIKVEIAR
jgi:Holliday junction resolvase RusA-like endonuclease